MKKLLLTIALALALVAPAAAQTLYRSASGWGVHRPAQAQRHLFGGPIGTQSPLWLGTEPSGTSLDAWLYMTGQPAGFDYAIYSGSTLPTVLSGDLSVATESTGGNLGAKNQITGLLRLNLVSLGAGTNGTTETTSYMDDTPDGEWAALDGDVVLSASTTYARVGSKSLKFAVAAAAAAGDGAAIDIANDDLEANESIGMWIYSDRALTAGDLTLVIDDTDASPDLAINFPAVTASAWQWIEIDISALTGGNGNVTDKIAVKLSTAGAALSAFTFYLDGVYKWDATDEDTLGDTVPYDGVLAVLNLDTANTGTHTFGNVTEYTDYFVNYQSGNEVLVWISDQSAKSNIVLYNY